MKKLVLMAVGVTGLLLAFPSNSKAGFNDLGPYFSFTWGDGGGIPPSVSNSASQVTSPDGLNVVLSGALGPISGADFADGFVLYWTGGFEGPINPGDQYTANLNFNVSVTGGTLEWSYYSDLWSNEGYEGADVYPNLTPMSASGQVTGASFDSPQFTQQGETGNFEGYLNIEWSNYSPTDTFSINVNSIDVTYEPVPEPSPFLMVSASLLSALVFRSFKIKSCG
jgi:hypothetical protein